MNWIKYSFHIVESIELLGSNSHLQYCEEKTEIQERITKDSKYIEAMSNVPTKIK